MVHVFGNIYFTVLDGLNYGLVKKRETKKGEDAFVTIGYYGTLEAALKRAIEIQVKHKYKDTKLVGLLSELKSIHKIISKLNCEDIKKELRKDKK